MIPLEDFCRKPDKTMLRISPNGRYLAWLEPYERRLNVVVQDTETGARRRVTDSTERDIDGFSWASDDRLVYVRDKGGDENHRLYSVGRDGSDPLDLTPFDGVKCGIIDDLPDRDDEILLQMNKRQAEIFDVYRLDVASGEMERIAENPGNIQSWHTDHDGRLRLAVTTDGVNSSILFRDEESDPWRTVATYSFKEYASPRLFTFDNRSLIVASNVGRDKTAVFEYDLATGKEGRLIYEHPEVDVDHVIYSRKRKKLTGVVVRVDRLDYRFLDPEREQIQKFVDEQLPGKENAVTSTSKRVRGTAP